MVVALVMVVGRGWGISLFMLFTGSGGAGGGGPYLGMKGLEYTKGHEFIP
jgi:hypothetical protein